MPTAFPALDAILGDSARIDSASLDRLVADHPAEAPLLLHLVELAECEEPKLQIAATALLKRYQAGGAAFSEEMVTRLLDILPSALHWEVTLHLLQMIAQLPIPYSHTESLCDSVRDLSQHVNTFVRAWAYGALHRLAALYPQYRSDVSPLLEYASQTESASVRARLRQLPPLDEMPSGA
jgi:hypothetical protein